MNLQDMYEVEQIQMAMMNEFKNKGIAPGDACMACLLMLSKFIAMHPEVKEKFIDVLNHLPNLIEERQDEQ